MFWLPRNSKHFCSLSLFFRLAFVILPLCAALAVRAETLPFKNFTTADGLGHDFVGRIVRDSRGFLWFCTGEGLSRFDGYEFKNYTQADGLPHRNINDLLELDDGTYLVATGDGLTIFNPKGESRKSKAESQKANPMFRTFRTDDPLFAKQPFGINSLHKTRDGRLWATLFGAIFNLVKNGDAWEFQKFEPEEWRGKNTEFFSMLEDRRGKLWFASARGIWLLDEKAGKITLLNSSGTSKLLEDREGRVWGNIGDSDSGLSLFTYPPDADLPVLTRRFTTKDGLTDDRWIHSILETSDGRILAGIRNGLCEFLPDAKAGEKSFRPLFAADIVSLAEDIGGNIWLGTSTKGAYKLTRRGFVFYDIPEKKPYGTASSIFISDGEVYATSSSFDLLRFDGEKFSEIVPFGMKDRSWGWGQLDLRSRIDGEWWIPTFAGLYRYPAVEFEDLPKTPPKKIYTKSDGLIAEDIFRLYEDSRGDIWFSGIAKTGVMRLERKTEKIQIFTTAENFPDHSAPTAFGEDAEGNLWIGFYTGGVGRFRHGKFDFFPAASRFPAGLVNAIYRDKAERLWIAVSNSGLVRVENSSADEPNFIGISVAEGLSSNQANCITEDVFGRIYVGTARGINRIEPVTGRIKIYSQADGLPGGIISRCASDKQGNLWFSQRFTIARLTPETEEKTSPPPIFISAVRVNGETARKLSELGETAVENLHFDTDQRQIQIDFFALGFSTGETLRYQYRFGDEDWSKPQSERTINLNRQAGDYIFQVRAVNSQGVTSENPATVSFSIAPPVWQRWWFLLLAALAVSGLIYFIYRYRVQRLLELERVRTRIATDLHDDIGSSLSQIAILSEVARQKVGGNGASEPLNLIADTSREMVDSMSDIVWAINPNKDTLGDLINRMRRFASDVLDAKDIAYRFHLPEKQTEISLGADVRREVYLMFKECVNNLAKHSDATEAELTIGIENGFLVIKVRDNGRGFHVPPFDEHTTFEGFGGNGLFNMKRRTENLGGSFEIRSESGAGTIVSIEIPVQTREFLGGLKKIWVNK